MHQNALKNLKKKLKIWLLEIPSLNFFLPTLNIHDLS